MMDRPAVLAHRFKRQSDRDQKCDSRTRSGAERFHNLIVIERQPGRAETQRVRRQVHTASPDAGVEVSCPISARADSAKNSRHVRNEVKVCRGVSPQRLVQRQSAGPTPAFQVPWPSPRCPAMADSGRCLALGPRPRWQSRTNRSVPRPRWSRPVLTGAPRHRLSWRALRKGWRP